MKPRTLSGRLALVGLASAAIWVVLLTVVFNVLIAASVGRQADASVRARAEAAAATLSTGPSGSLRVTEPVDDAALDSNVWIYQGNRALERPKAANRFQRFADRAAPARSTYETYGGARWYVRPVRIGGQSVGRVVAATDLAPYRGTTTLALYGSIGLAVLLLTGIYVLTRVIVARALRPVDLMSHQAADWSWDGMDRRFGTDHPRPAELANLATQLDLLLDRLAAVLRHEQNWGAELSHELRTPLARIVAESDWLASRPSEFDQDASITVIRSAADQMQQITDSLLAEARSRGNGLPGTCDIGLLLDDVASTWPDSTVRLRIDLPVGRRVIAGASAELVQRALAPLLENARRYATGSVTVAVTTGHGIRLAVSDDGPGVPDEVADRLFEPGFRACADDGHAGAGLGLALARRLGRSMGGDVVYDRRGAFVIGLPEA